jgi:2-succinyl-5-enolpyruvyl-6-hydroxy-3-cyclohexene-1-carboxylate synthase
MDDKYYSSERNVQIVISLLKQYGIRKIIVSPGATNVTFVASVMHDTFFELFSCVDERSAAYMACGMAAESGESVVLSCTGATASRNYLSGLTEAYYRKLPVIAITSTQNPLRIGNLIAQVIDRSTIQNDVSVFSFMAETIHDDESERACVVGINKALHLATSAHEGPVHINLQTQYSRDYSVEQLPHAPKIEFYRCNEQLPVIPDGRIGIFIGSHRRFSQEETLLIDAFCAKYDSVVFCDHTSGYKGKYRFMGALVGCQVNCDYSKLKMALVIHLGEVSGDYHTQTIIEKSEKVWRVSPDGEPRDTFKKLTAVFRMSPREFFAYYSKGDSKPRLSFLQSCREEYKRIYDAIPDELSFSNIWMAKQLAPLLPEHSVLHLGILNSLRSWNLFDVHSSIQENSNVGGFGIDGCVSSLLGASLVNSDKLFFGVFGDLAFFYDMNSIGSRHVGKNLRILVVNNGRGMEFRNYIHHASVFGEEADNYIAAARHYGNQSHSLLKHYAEDLGFSYISATDKESFLKILPVFISTESDKPIILEAFTTCEDENNALYDICHIKQLEGKQKMKENVRKVIGESGVAVLNKILKR